MIYGWNHHTSGSSNDLYDIGALDFTIDGINSGIADGLRLSPTTPASSDEVELTAGMAKVHMGDYRAHSYILASGETITLADATSGTTNYIGIEVNVTDATEQIVVSDTPFSNSPSPEIYYLTLYTVDATGANLTASDITRVAGSTKDGWRQSIESFTFDFADNPTFGMTVSGDFTDEFRVGTRFKIVQPTGTGYFVASKDATVSSNVTTIWLYGGNDDTGYDLGNEAINEVYWSHDVAPAGFPLDYTWVLNYVTTGSTQGSPTQNIRYNIGGSFIVPAGTFMVETHCSVIGQTVNSETGADMVVGIGSTNSNFVNTEVGQDSFWFTVSETPLQIAIQSPIALKQHIITNTNGTYYINAAANVSGMTSISLDNPVTYVTPLFV